MRNWIYRQRTNESNETVILFFALLFTVGLLGAIGSYFLTENNENFSQVKNVPSGLFRYGGSTTWAPIRRDADPKIHEVWDKFQLAYTDPITGSPGSTRGIEMLLNNQLSFSQSSRGLKLQEYQQAQQQGYTLREIPVAIDGIAIAVNYQLNIPGLSITQLKDIYIGNISNWRELGGPDLPITLYSRKLTDGGTVEFFVDNILEKQKFSPKTQYISTTTEALRKVALTPGGIYYASAPEIVGQCIIKPLPLGRTSAKLISPYKEPFVPPQQCPKKRNVLNTSVFMNAQYPITRRLFVIVKQDGQADQKAGEAYAKLLLTNQGQDLISQAGFVRISN